MNKIPFSKFVLQEAKDCPICLTQFTSDSEVVQLKCNKTHIFHFDCLNQYLRYENQEGPIIK